MDLESQEVVRAASVISVMQSMTQIATGQEAKASMEDRLVAAKIVDSMSDTIVKAWLTSEVAQVAEGASKKMNKQIDRLLDDQNK